MLLVVGLACGSLFVGWYRQSSPPEEDPAIILTDNGFSPAELRVRLGETVTFTSSLDSQYWPASNLHPAHDIYPESDPKRPLLPGESWSFTFDRPGAWRFHDHLRSYYTGVIYVEE